jgi:hypothetical protein
VHIKLRTMALKAETRAEHRLWVQGLAYLCPHAAYNGECMLQNRVN